LPLFPVCAAVFVRAQSPSFQVDGTALDYVVQYLLPGPWGQHAAAQGVRWNVGEGASALSRELMVALCRRQAGAYQHVVDALAKSAARELVRPPHPRPAAVQTYATCVVHCRRPCVMRAFLTSGIADSLVQSLDKMDLNAEGMSEVVSAVLRAVEELGKTWLSVQRIAGEEDQGNVLSDDEFDNWPASRLSDPRLDRRSARSLFETLQHHAAGDLYPDVEAYGEAMESRFGQARLEARRQNLVRRGYVAGGDHVHGEMGLDFLDGMWQ
jgi:hypothetical protein